MSRLDQAADASDPDAAVRAYLDLLRRRNGGPGGLDAAIMRTSDSMERVRLMEERRRLAEQQTGLEVGFVTHARDWARQWNVLREAFLAEGVPPDVLDRAGL